MGRDIGARKFQPVWVAGNVSEDRRLVGLSIRRRQYKVQRYSLDWHFGGKSSPCPYAKISSIAQSAVWQLSKISCEVWLRVIELTRTCLDIVVYQIRSALATICRFSNYGFMRISFSIQGGYLFIFRITRWTRVRWKLYSLDIHSNVLLKALTPSVETVSHAIFPLIWAGESISLPLLFQKNNIDISIEVRANI